MGISHNGIGPEGATALAHALTRNTSLQRLFLNSNPLLGDVGVQSLVEALGANKTLLRLGVAMCNAGVSSGDALLAALRNNPTVERVCVFGSSFSGPSESVLRGMHNVNFFEIHGH